MSTSIDLVIFGARGDLSHRKLIPALYALDRAGLLPQGIRIAGLARDEMAADVFIEKTAQRLQQRLGEDNWSLKTWQRFAKKLTYIQLDFSQPDQYANLRGWLNDKRLPIYYLATPPSLFGPICQNLAAADCVNSKARIVLEKPIGHDLQSSMDVNSMVASVFPETNVYRIDHYLGKETVQNLMVLRFANRLINSQWDNTCIDHVQITAAETVGIEGRWGYYDNVGQLRDMMQNHLLQLLCMVTMEPPNALVAEEIRAEKVKILRALSPVTSQNVTDVAVRGQYTAGWISGEPVVGYMEEEGSVKTSSQTETFVALKTYIDNWRWAGVPFYLRTGKRMTQKMTEVVITYKDHPHAIFPNAPSDESNRLIIRLQPNEGIELDMVSKTLNLEERMDLEKRTLNLDFFDSSQNSRIPDAYERLLLEVMKGDQWLFVSREEIEASWRWCDGIIDAWQDQDVKHYAAGSWGPSKSELLIEKDERSWHSNE